MAESAHRLDSPITVAVKEANRYGLSELPAGSVFNATGSTPERDDRRNVQWSRGVHVLPGTLRKGPNPSRTDVKRIVDLLLNSDLRVFIGDTGDDSSGRQTC